MQTKVLEICANSVTSAIAAQDGGAQRVELCTNLNEGGTTPSYGEIKWCVDNLTIGVWPIIRPRGGDFLYNDIEFETMLLDISYCKKAKCNGIVTGILNKDGDIDIDRCKQIIEAAAPMPVAFHRAFDMSKNLDKALDDIINLGFVRILTSGGENNALSGAKTIKRLIEKAIGRIEIMPGGGINIDNILTIAKITGAKAFHTSAKAFVNSKMKYQNEQTKMADFDTSEFQIAQTDIGKVIVLSNAISNYK